MTSAASFGNMTATLPKSGDGTYTFASQPRAVPQQRKKYRDPVEPQETTRPAYTNMMFDPRIVRGNTYRQQTLSATALPDPVELQKQQDTLRKKQARKKLQESQRVKTPEATDGRKHMDVQTELYLEELADRPEEADVETQTDAFLDRPPSPVFIPPKTGQDVSTQIEDGELFDFDLEVKPIVEVLVGKTVEQALMEVMEEEELDRLRTHQRAFDELRNNELLEVQRKEEAARRSRAEKERRIKQAKEAADKEKETAEKVAARAFAVSFLSELVPSVFTSLHQGGYFYDQYEREVESVFIPWLMQGVEDQLGQRVQSRRVLEDLIAELAQKRCDQYQEPEPEPEIESTSSVPAQPEAEASAEVDADKELEPEAEEASAEVPASENNQPDDDVTADQLGDGGEPSSNSENPEGQADSGEPQATTE